MKKLKAQYKHAFVKNKYDHEWLVYPHMRSDPIKKFSTKQEKACYYQHQIEYREYRLLKLRAARGKALAHVNDDIPTICYDFDKSWKHNSKRKKQYIPH